MKGVSLFVQTCIQALFSFVGDRKGHQHLDSKSMG